MKKLLFALVLLLVPVAASAQCNGVFANNTVCGNITGSSNLPRPTNPSAFLGAAGGANGQIQYNNGGALGGFGPITGDITLTVPGGVSALVSGAANTLKGSLNGSTVTNLPVPSCASLGQVLQYTSGVGFSCTTAGVTGSVIVFPSRAAAAALNLTGYTTIRTLGYATAGDGGGATFQNVGAAAFIDSGLGGNSGAAASCTIVAGSGYTNGTYRGVYVSVGGTGGFTSAQVNITIAGGVVTAVNTTAQRGQKFAVGNVLVANGGNAQIGGTGSGFTCTITAVVGVLASFTDTAGNHWQYTPDVGTYPNIRQFGAKLDWDGVDGSATDDWNAWQAALQYASIGTATAVDSGGFIGGKLFVPRGSSLICGPGANNSLIIPYGVVVKGGGTYNTQMHKCSAFSQAVHFVELCDPTIQLACFDSRLEDISLFANRNDLSDNLVFMVHTNATQHDGGLYKVNIWAGKRGCTWFEKGYGGASTVTFSYVECSAAGANTMMKFGNTIASGLNYGTTIINMNNIILGGPSSATLQTGPGITLEGGFYDIVGVHCEAMPTCIQVGIGSTGNNDMVRIHNINAANISGGTACTALVVLTAINVLNNTILGMIPPSSCTVLVQNNQAGGSNYNTALVTDARFNPNFVQP